MVIGRLRFLFGVRQIAGFLLHGNVVRPDSIVMFEYTRGGRTMVQHRKVWLWKIQVL